MQASKSLKIVKLQNTRCEDLSFISTMTKLEELQFDNCVLPTDSNQFYFLDQLTKLRVYTDKLFDVVDLVRRLINLKEFTIDGGFQKWILNRHVLWTNRLF